MPQTVAETDFIETPYGKKRWALIKHMFDTHQTMLSILKECKKVDILPPDLKGRLSAIVEECDQF